MGTAVGITARASRADVAAAFAAIETFEAELSEWRPGSATSRMRSEGPQRLSVEGMALFAWVEKVRIASDGAFNVGWKGASLTVSGDTVSATGPVDLGGVLKGFLADRAADALVGRGVEDFVVDAAGDIVAHGNAGDCGGWPVTVETTAGAWRLRVRNAAVSTSAEDQQPDHILDGRSGMPSHCLRSVTVTAATGMEADAWATAFYASCGKVDLPKDVVARWISNDGKKRRQSGAD
jgi:FAD:protein FMN transferase